MFAGEVDLGVTDAQADRQNTAPGNVIRLMPTAPRTSRYRFAASMIGLFRYVRPYLRRRISDPKCEASPEIVKQVVSATFAFGENA